MVLAHGPIAALVTALAIQAQAQTVPPQSTEAPPAEPMTISGRVTDRETGQPLPRARVGLYAGTADVKRPALRSTVTDARGYYELPDLPAGKYTVAAMPPPGVVTHLSQVYGLDAPFDPLSAVYIVPQSLSGQDLRDVDIALLRASAIEGRVVNRDGDPLAGIAVALNRGDRLASDPVVRFTDDRGTFRHFGLAPGRYRMCASVPAGADGTADSLRRTCYPDGGDPIEIGTGTVSGIEMRMTSGRAATVSGIVLDASGAPLERPFLEIADENGVDRKPLPVEPLPGGRFVARNVERGTYRVIAARRAVNPLDPVSSELVILSVRVDGDVDNLVVRTRAAAGVSGVVIFEDGAPPPGPGKMMVHARSETVASGAILGMPSLAMVQRSAVVQADSSFRLDGILGPARIAVSGQPGGWLVRSITYGGRDIFESPVEFDASGDVPALTIVLTKRVATLAGRVTPPTTRKRALLLITGDRTRWTSRSAVAGTTSVKEDGTFSFAPVLAGDYVVATTHMTWMLDPPQALASAIERLTAQAVMLSLGEGERRQLTIYVADDR